MGRDSWCHDSRPGGRGRMRNAVRIFSDERPEELPQRGFAKPALLAGEPAIFSQSQPIARAEIGWKA